MMSWRFIFELPNNEASLLPVASCVVVKSSDPEALKDSEGRPIIRPYTPISRPDVKGSFTLLVKTYENGNASKHIHSLKVIHTGHWTPAQYSPVCRRATVSRSKGPFPNSLTKVCLFLILWIQINPLISKRIRRGCIHRWGDRHVGAPHSPGVL